MARRAVWKGSLSFGKLSFSVGLYSALSSEEKISFHIVNRKTGNRVERQFVDSETGKPVDRDEQIRGHETEDGDYVTVEPDALKALAPEGDKVISVRSFITCDDIDKLYFDKPYYLAPTDEEAEDAFRLFAQALEKESSAAFAEAVLFRRNRALLIRPHDDTLIATTLNYDYEVRSAKRVFASLKAEDYDDEMLDLAGHIIDTRMGTFDPADYEDRYNSALAAVIRAKLEGKPLKPAKFKEADNVTDLREALRQSAKAAGAQGKSGKRSSSKSKQRKAG
ncbi:Ku protein [Rhizobium sp. L1K21]|uniref:non-homologous end joining protein Ku n=1 Tax=Rhizobium sp. L1K21 TaxID=2954933 RepID=UPI002092A63B|nr:Ku protein [Rhizobium sp. L1K21]